MGEEGANEELFPLLCVSPGSNSHPNPPQNQMHIWDDEAIEESAPGFLEVFQKGLISSPNADFFLENVVSQITSDNPKVSETSR